MFRYKKSERGTKAKPGKDDIHLISKFEFLNVRISKCTKSLKTSTFTRYFSPKNWEREKRSLARPWLDHWGGSNPIFPDPDFGKTWQGRMQAAGGVIGVSYLYATWVKRTQHDVQCIPCCVYCIHTMYTTTQRVRILYTTHGQQCEENVHCTCDQQCRVGVSIKKKISYLFAGGLRTLFFSGLDFSLFCRQKWCSSRYHLKMCLVKINSPMAQYKRHICLFRYVAESQSMGPSKQLHVEVPKRERTMYYVIQPKTGHSTQPWTQLFFHTNVTHQDSHIVMLTRSCIEIQKLCLS